MTTLTLREPIEINGAKIGVLTLRRPKVRDLEAIDKIAGETAKTVALIARTMQPATLRAVDISPLSPRVTGAKTISSSP